MSLFEEVKNLVSFEGVPEEQAGILNDGDIYQQIMGKVAGEDFAIVVRRVGRSMHVEFIKLDPKHTIITKDKVDELLNKLLPLADSKHVEVCASYRGDPFYLVWEYYEHKDK